MGGYGGGGGSDQTPKSQTRERLRRPRPRSDGGTPKIAKLLWSILKQMHQNMCISKLGDFAPLKTVVSPDELLRAQQHKGLCSESTHCTSNDGDQQEPHCPGYCTGVQIPASSSQRCGRGISIVLSKKLLELRAHPPQRVAEGRKSAKSRTVVDSAQEYPPSLLGCPLSNNNSQTNGHVSD